MVNLDIWQLLAAFVAAMGIPGAVMGLLIRKIERRISKREAAMEQREAEQDELRMMLTLQIVQLAVKKLMAWIF